VHLTTEKENITAILLYQHSLLIFQMKIESLLSKSFTANWG